MQYHSGNRVIVITAPLPGRVFSYSAVMFFRTFYHALIYILYAPPPRDETIDFRTEASMKSLWWRTYRITVAQIERVVVTLQSGATRSTDYWLNTAAGRFISRRNFKDVVMSFYGFSSNPKAFVFFFFFFPVRKPYRRAQSYSIYFTCDVGRAARRHTTKRSGIEFQKRKLSSLIKFRFRLF